MIPRRKQVISVKNLAGSRMITPTRRVIVALRLGYLRIERFDAFNLHIQQEPILLNALPEALGEVQLRLSDRASRRGGVRACGRARSAALVRLPGYAPSG